jgi:hypothetical protein
MRHEPGIRNFYVRQKGLNERGNRREKRFRKSRNNSIFKSDEFVKNREPGFSGIPAKAGIQLFQLILDPGACPGPDPGFAGVTTLVAFCKCIK